MSAPNPIGTDSAPRHKRGPVERGFEKMLWKSRLLVLLAVVPSIIGAGVLFVIGVMDILKLVTETWGHHATGSTADIHETVVTNVVGALDVFLIAIVLLIFSLGTYKLFISRIEAAEESEVPHMLDVSSIEDLKDRIARVVVLAVIIEFFRAVVDIQFDTALDAIYLALSVFALAAAIFLMKWAQKW